jgi:hypothetical protein
MKDRNDPATIARCKETGKCQFIDVINIFLFTVSLYLAGTFKIYIAPSGIDWCSKYLSTPSGITWWSIFN